MQKIIAYEAFSVLSPAELDDFINQKIKSGWQPYGYMQACSNGAGVIVYTQVVVKYE